MGLVTSTASAQTLTTSNVQINWQVENRFRLFRNAGDFQAHERAWQQYLIHVNNLGLPEEDKQRLAANSSVIGTEHVLNDRYIPFTRHLRTRYDWRGWAAKTVGDLCWDAATRSHAACGGSEAYVVPKSHRVKIWLTSRDRAALFAEYNCEWRVNGGAAETAP